MRLTESEQHHLLAIARRAMELGVSETERPAISALPEGLREERATFVTLSIEGALRGCVGSLVASAPLAFAVADAADGAARRDPRFPPLRREEWPRIRIEVSVLSALEPLRLNGRQSLLDALRPGVDGLLLEDGRHRSTFLPKVWETIPEPGNFLSQLLLKAGLPAKYWSDTLRARRYTAVSYSE